MTQNHETKEKEVPTHTSLAYTAMRRAYNRCGIGVLTLTLALAFVVPLIILFLRYLEGKGFPILSFFQKNLLFFNEGLIAVAMAAGALVFMTTPRVPPERKKFSYKLILVLFCIAVAFSTIGSTLGQFWVSVWNTVMGGEVSDPLSEALTETNLFQTFICVGILAPFIEELFFRKLLIDRLYGHGELAAILTSGVLFAFFHENMFQFFYTLAAGILLAYLYCRTGSYLATVLLHMLFNLFSGILPLILDKATAPFYAALETATEEEYATLAAEYAPAVVFDSIYVLLTFVFIALGIFFFIRYARNVVIEQNQPLLSPKKQARAVFLNFGMIAALAVYVFELFLSLLTG